jgi:hypothetical protein
MIKSSPKLTSRDVWRLIKYALTMVVLSVICFAAPYYIILGGGTLISGRLGCNRDYIVNYLYTGIILYVILSNLSYILAYLGEFFLDLSKITESMSLIKKAFIVVLLIGCYSAWRVFPIVMLIILCVFFVAGFTYEKYRTILKEKVIKSEDQTNYLMR